MTRFTNLAILVMALGLAGCGGNDPSSNPAAPTVATAALVVTQAQPARTVQGGAPASGATAVGGAVAEASGVLLVLQEDDFKTGATRTRHFLDTAEGRVELNFAGKAPELRSGMRFIARGLRNGNTINVNPGSGEGEGEEPAATASVPVLGERKTLVLLVNFQDNTSQPYSQAEANDIVFTQASNFFKENSQQQVSLTGATYGWYTLPLSQTTCSVFQIENAAKQAATTAGVDLTGYNHFVYVFPNTTACAWGGLSTIGGSSVWINGNLKVSSVSHELIHNLGLQHSHAKECGATAIGASCTNVDYGDPLDVMGSTNPGHLNAVQKERLGWLNNDTMPPITLVQATGNYTVSAYAAAGTGAKALKILKSTDPTTGVKTWYYIEYRTATGSDSFISTLNNTNVPNGLVVHTAADNGGSYLHDMTPAS